METLAAFTPALPEIILAAGAMLFLMLGVFSADTARTGVFIGWLTVLLMAGVAIMIGTSGAERVELFDGAFVVDAFSRFCKVLILGAAAVSLMLSFGYFERERIMKFEIPVIALLSTVGMFMMVSANDLISLYLGLELMSLALYVLAAVHRDSLRSSEFGLEILRSRRPVVRHAALRRLTDLRLHGHHLVHRAGVNFESGRSGSEHRSHRWPRLLACRPCI